MLGAIRQAYRCHLKGQRTEASLVATATYFVTLIAVRGYTTLIHPGPDGDIAIGGTHFHHVVFGIVALLVAGFLALDEIDRLPRSVLFGVGAALVLDEFALVVFLKDVYWLPQGLLSIFALLVGFVALGVNTMRSGPFLREVAGAIGNRKE